MRQHAFRWRLVAGQVLVTVVGGRIVYEQAAAGV